MQMTLLHKGIGGTPWIASWNYRTLIDMLIYLQESICPNIAMVVHKCARLSANPKLSHKQAVKTNGQYFLGVKACGTNYCPDKLRGIDCFADFAGGQNKVDSTDLGNVLSQAGFVIFYAGCPVLCASQLMTEIVLSMVETEYMTCSMAMQSILSFIFLMEETSGKLRIKFQQPKYT